MANMETANTQTDKQPKDQFGFGDLAKQFKPIDPLPEMSPEPTPPTPQERVHERLQKHENIHKNHHKIRGIAVRAIAALALAGGITAGAIAYNAAAEQPQQVPIEQLKDNGNFISKGPSHIKIGADNLNVRKQPQVIESGDGSTNKIGTIAANSEFDVSDCYQVDLQRMGQVETNGRVYALDPTTLPEGVYQANNPDDNSIIYILQGEDGQNFSIQSLTPDNTPEQTNAN